MSETITIKPVHYKTAMFVEIRHWIPDGESGEVLMNFLVLSEQPLGTMMVYQRLCQFIKKLKWKGTLKQNPSGVYNIGINEFQQGDFLTTIIYNTVLVQDCIRSKGESFTTIILP